MTEIAASRLPYQLVNLTSLNRISYTIGYQFAFRKYPRTTIDSLGTPYDYKSIMHYEAYDFSKNRKVTIAAKNSGVSIYGRTIPSYILLSPPSAIADDKPDVSIHYIEKSGRHSTEIVKVSLFLHK